MSDNNDLDIIDIVDVDGEVISSSTSIGNNEDIIDIDLDFDLSQSSITKEELNEAARLNELYSMQTLDKEFDIPEMSVDNDEISSKFKTLIYLNRKTSAALQKEIKTFKRDVLESYELAVKSSVAEHEVVYRSIVHPNSSSTSDLDIAIGNAVYQSRIHNLSMDNIVDNLSIRLSFNKMNSQLVTRSLLSAELQMYLKGYKYHMEILVPIILDKLAGSWYEHLLDQYDTILGLITPTLLKSHDSDEIEKLCKVEAVASYNAANSSKKIDNYIMNVLSGGINLFRSAVTQDTLKEKLDNISDENLIIDFLRSQKISDMNSGHIQTTYPNLDELRSLDGTRKEFDTFFRDYGFNEEERIRFGEIITTSIDEAVKQDGKSILTYRYHDDSLKTSAGKGTIYNDFSIPVLFQNWKSFYATPFSDREVLTMFLQFYVALCRNDNIQCSLDLSNPLNSLLSSKIDVKEYSDILTFVNKAIYSRTYPITSVAEYVFYIQHKHEQLGIPAPLYNTKEDSIFYGADYLSYKMEYTDTLYTDIGNRSFTLVCDECSKVIDQDSNENTGSIPVSDYMTVIRMDPNNSTNGSDFNLDESIRTNIMNMSVNSDQFNDLGLIQSETSDLICQELYICPNCGKVFSFSEKIYRALDICAQKFISERTNSSSLVFVQRCTLSRQCVEEFEPEFFRWFDESGISLEDGLPLDLPKIEEKEYVQGTEDTDTYSDFDLMADEFIANLSKNKKQYEYESSVQELETLQSLSKPKQEMVVDVNEIMTTVENIVKGSTQNSEDTDDLTRIKIDKVNLDKKYYDNFIWYFLSNYLIDNMDSTKLLKLRISELFGKKVISEVLTKYSEMKNILKELGKNQFKLISDLNNSGVFKSVDLAGDSMEYSLDIPSISDDTTYKLGCKYINMGKRVLMNSDNEEEFMSNLGLCSIDGKPLNDEVKEVLLVEYKGEKAFDYSNEKLQSKLETSISEQSNSKEELINKFETLRNEISELILGVDLSSPSISNEGYLDFNLDEFCIILGSIRLESELQDVDYSEYFSEIDRVGGKFMSRLDEQSDYLDDGGLSYLYYLLSTVDYDVKYTEIRKTKIFRNIYQNLGIICREWIYPSNEKINATSKITEQFKEYCKVEVDNKLSCIFHKELMCEAHNTGVKVILDTLKDNFRDFGFRVLEKYSLDLYNPRLANSIIGKGISKLQIKLRDCSSETEFQNCLKSYPTLGKVFPRLTIGPLSGEVKKYYSKYAENCKFRVVDENGVLVNTPELVDKVRIDILAMFLLMDIEFCTRKYSDYEQDIFKLFNQIFSLPSSFINEGLEDSIKELDYSNLDLSYDTLKEHLSKLCSEQVVYDCVVSGNEINYSLEKNQIDELTMLSKLCLDSSPIPYHAAKGLISSTLVSIR